MSAVSLVLGGCAYGSMAVRSIGYKTNPSLEKAARSAPEGNVLIGGWLARAPSAVGASVAVAAVAREDDDLRIIDLDFPGTAGQFWFSLPPAQYEFLAFSDLDGDEELHHDELVGRVGEPATLRHTRKNGGFLPLLELPVDAVATHNTVLDVDLDVGDLPPIRPPSLASNLGDERFGDTFANLGMVAPRDFVHSMGPLHFLEPPDFSGAKVPIVFVHGLSGSPRDFASIVGNLDRSRYQAWFFYYPSGGRLDTAAHLLHEIFFSGHYLPRMPRVVVVAHSMGGLVARGALNLLTRQLRPGTGGHPEKSPVVLFVSFVTPYGGVAGAELGVLGSPVRLASWMDVTPDSDYLTGLKQTQLPKETFFALMFGCSRASSDGTVSLESQLAAPHRAQADLLIPERASHVGILGDRHALATFHHLLDAAAFPNDLGAPLPAPEGDGCSAPP